MVGEQQPELGVERIYGQKLHMGSQLSREAVSITETIPEATAKLILDKMLVVLEP